MSSPLASERAGPAGPTTPAERGDVVAAPLLRPARPPVELARLVIRRAGLVIVLVLALALVLGLARLQRDVGDELAGATALARLTEVLATASALDDATLLDALRRLQGDGALRHLQLRVRDADGRDLLPAPPTGTASLPGRVASWFERATDTDAHGVVGWPLQRPQGPAWQVTLRASPDSERREALASGLESLALLLLLGTAVLVAMAWSVRRSLQPLHNMRRAIECIGQHDGDSLRRLPPLPVAELESIAAALRRMAAALEAARARQRLLGQQVLTLQEDERQRLARELHDEFGQRLTAMRVDAAWLHKRLQPGGAPAADELAQVAAGIGAQCERFQLDLRQLLAHLQPLGVATEAATLQRLAELLASLVAGWSRDGCTRYRLRLSAADVDDRALDWAAVAACPLERTTALALYRISQEALTNVARHAHAAAATLALHAVVAVDHEAVAPALRALDWAVEDDGAGVPDVDAALRRGNGLAGIHERLWALGSDLRLAPLRPGAAARPGLRLAAHIEIAAAASGAG